MNIKQLLLISALYTFSAQAMQEVKREQEIKENSDSKEVVELRELKRRFPASISFLVKVLGAQKNKQKTLFEKINPFAKDDKSIVIKKGLPNDLILKIINNYLRIDKMKFKNNKGSIINPEDMVDAVTAYYHWDYNTSQDADCMSLVPNSIGQGKYDLSIGKHVVDRNGQRGLSWCNAEFQFMDHSVLDINPNLDRNTNSQFIIATTRDNKYKVIAGLVTLAGITYYVVKKLKK